jgi:hypothetical protein
VVGGRSRWDHEPLGDLLVRQAGTDQPRDVLLASVGTSIARSAATLPARELYRITITPAWAATSFEDATLKILRSRRDE